MYTINDPLIYLFFKNCTAHYKLHAHTLLHLFVRKFIATVQSLAFYPNLTHYN